MIKIYSCCNWTGSKSLIECWSKMLTQDNRVILTEDKTEADYYFIVNSPLSQDEPFFKTMDKKTKRERVIVFRMEPLMETRRDLWGDYWRSPPESDFLKVFYHDSELNNVEWHLNKTVSQLKETPIKKMRGDVISFIVSPKYFDPGHIKRVNFWRYLQKNSSIVNHVFGSNIHNLKNYVGSLPLREKEDGLIPYRYTFNAENNSINGYATEKIWDAIMSETLIFYWGCPNIEEYIDERCFIRLGLDDFEKDLQIVVSAIENNEWEKRLPYIKETKLRLLEKYNLTDRLLNVIQ